MMEEEVNLVVDLMMVVAKNLRVEVKHWLEEVEKVK